MLDKMVSQLDKEPDFMDHYVDLSTFLSKDTLETQSGFSYSTVEDVSALCEVPSSVKRKLETVDVESLELIHTGDHTHVPKKVRVSTPTEICDIVENVGANNGKPGLEEKYKYKCCKKNVASKCSREIKKMKYVELEKEASRLEKSNGILREKIEVLEKLAKDMKASLIENMSGDSH